MGPSRQFRAVFRIGTALLVAAAAALIAPPGIKAQKIIGHVVEEGTAVPIPFADVVLLDTLGTAVARTTTDSIGYFTFQADPGLYRMQAQRLGYATATSEAILFRPDEPLVVELHLSAVGIPLEPLVVRARGVERGRDAFARRQALDTGMFLTRDSIALREPRKVTDAFNGVRAIFMMESPRGVTIRTMRGFRCLALFVDFHVNPFAMSGEGGLPSARRLNPGPDGEGADRINMFIDPEKVEGIEIYYTYWDIPEELRTASRVGWVWPCGIAIIWTSVAW